jgi:putative tryptophan/tyrosine transport system substrate-binding protein
LSGKWVELLKQIAPGITRTAVLRDFGSSAGIGQWAIIQAGASSFGMEALPINLREPSQIEQAVREFARPFGEWRNRAYRVRLVRTARRRCLP